MSKATDRFLQNEALTLTMTGALAVRGGTPVYRKGTSDSDREEVRNHIKCLLRSIAGGYEAAVSEEEHIKAIECISEEISRSYRDKLYALPGSKGRFRIGCAQKALNLNLKYSWAFGWIPPPPHCPFDRGVLEKLDLPTKYKQWTGMDDIGVYRAWVEAAKKKAKADRLSLPCWEVQVWNDWNEKNLKLRSR